MRPLSPVYYIKENKARCLALIFMLFLGYAAYLGGIYVTNPADNWVLPIKYYNEEFVQAYPKNDNSGEADIADKFKQFEQKLKQDAELDVIKLGVFSSSLNWETIMTFETGTFYFPFLTVDDFKNYCEHVGISCDFDKLKNGSMIMSEKFAKNKGLKIGDVVDTDYDINIYDTYTLDALTNEDGYTLYFIDDRDENLNILIFSNGMDHEKITNRISELSKEMGITVVQPSLEEEIGEQFTPFYRIYYFILILVAIILAVTINATFVGMYQQRKPEFAVYKAIGISKKKVVGKIAGELLCMDVVAMVLGGAIFFTGLYLFNHLVLYPVGKYLNYFHPIAFIGLLVCNIMVIVPLIVTRSRQMLKADICDY